MSENNGPFREKEVTLDDLMKEIVSTKKTIDHEMANLKSKLNAPSTTSLSQKLAARLKTWLEESFFFWMFHYTVRYLMIAVGLLALGSAAATVVFRTDPVERVNGCTVACESVNAEFTTYTENSCMCAYSDGMMFVIESDHGELHIRNLEMIDIPLEPSDVP